MTKPRREHDTRSLWRSRKRLDAGRCRIDRQIRDGSGRFQDNQVTLICSATAIRISRQDDTAMIHKPAAPQHRRGTAVSL